MDIFPLYIVCQKSKTTCQSITSITQVFMIYMLKSIRNKKRYLCVQNFHLLNLNLQAYNMSLEVLKEASIDGGVSQYIYLRG